MPLRRRLMRSAVWRAAATAALAIASPAWASSIAPLHPAHAGAEVDGVTTLHNSYPAT
ncbi:hypothetical protein [Micromonospora sp. NBC_00617]|uniref:hypothetical protein n=1 Tax=Micromonospora sp. NBC_00617 TaxID=2903587 RepID=UPI0030E10ACF